MNSEYRKDTKVPISQRLFRLLLIPARRLRSIKHRFALRSGLVLCGCTLGILAAYSVSHIVQLEVGRIELQRYADRLLKIREQIVSEDSRAIAAVANDGLPFCSDEELTFMRDYAFRSQHIRVMGRTKDGFLYCSTTANRLAHPMKMPVPNVIVNDVKTYIQMPLLFSNKTIGQVFEKDGVTLVFNFDFFKTLEEPPMSYDNLLFDRQNHNMLSVIGTTMPLTVDEVVAGKFVSRNGSLYQPLCSSDGPNCIVATEPRNVVLARSRWFAFGGPIVGALLGGMFTLILIQFYKRGRSMENQLRRALRNNSLTVAYQPIVDLETEKIVGAEALVRWINEDGEHMRPDIFVALAEEKGFVGEITRFVALRAMEELGDLLLAGDFRITLNIVSRDLTDSEFLPYLKWCRTTARIQPSSIGLELTERSTADQPNAMEAISDLHDTGHAVYIDDFGTGYSSLAYLHRLQVDAIKIDRAFTQTVGTDAVTASVVPQILAMAEQLDLLVVVEGIETRQQADYFREVGRGVLGQGWLFGKPMTAPQFRQVFLKAT
jgi:sensor c-di-GMP phosphodiesterase-like protein